MLDHFELLPGDIPSLRVGSSPNPLVVLHGGQGFMRSPDPHRFARDARRLRRLLPHGASFLLVGYGPPPAEGTGLETQADRLAAALAGQPRPLLGLSFGGLLAARLAARHPDLVSDLVLLASAHAFSAEGLDRLRRQARLAQDRRWPELAAEFGGVFRRRWLNWLLALRVATRSSSLGAEMSEPDHIVGWLRAALSADGTAGTDWLRAVRARSLILGGERDQFFGDGRMEETADAIPGARLRLIPGETHMAPVERASEVRRSLGAFLGTRS